MQNLFFITVLSSLVTNYSYSQRIVANIYFPDIDEPHQINRNILTTKNRIVKSFNCPDSVFKESECVCTKIEFYNDSGMIIKLITGKDISKTQIDYTVKYLSTNDSICEVETDYSAHYIDSLSLFMIDTTIKKKSKKLDIYSREKNKNLVIKSVLKYKPNNDYPNQILRYDKNGDLKEIYYPLGNRAILKEWGDTIVTENDIAIYENTIFPENSFQSYVKLSKTGQILETGYTNNTYNSLKTSEKTVYTYDDSSNIIFKLTHDEMNEIIKTERYKYLNGNLIKYSMDNNLSDTFENEIRTYDPSGNIIEMSQRSIAYPNNTWKWSYFYKGKIQIRTDYFRNNAYQGSKLFLYD